MTAKHFHRIVFRIAIVLFAVTAYFSKGYHHFDEHFQIIEFAGLKLGFNHPADLAWEYEARIRPAFQPMIVVLLIKGARLLGIESPFTQLFIIRLLMGMFCLWGIRLLVNQLLDKLQEEQQTYFILLSYFLYFIPYVAVRFSSETLGGAFFLWAFGWVLRNEKMNIENGAQRFYIGILLGAAFICRFQVAFMIAGLGLWLMFIGRWPLKQILILSAGFMFATALGLLCDSWFYGQWVCTPFNYVRVNIVEGKAASFGVAPWYFYITDLFGSGRISIVNILVLLTAIYFLIANHKNMIAFTILPFLSAHLLVAHKEMRFMIPVVFFLPYIISFSWQHFIGFIRNGKMVMFFRRILFLLLFINFGWLFVYAIKPADGQPLVYEFLSRHYYSTPLDIYYTNETCDWYCGQASLPMNFYSRPQFRLQQIAKDAIPSLPNFTTGREAVVITPYYNPMNQQFLVKIFEILPQRLRAFNENDWMKMKNADWVVYKLRFSHPLRQ